MKRSFIKELLSGTDEIDSVQIKGWVRTRRNSKDIVFIEVNDGTCLSNIQVIATSLLDSYNSASIVPVGSSVCVEGALTASQGKEQKFEIQAVNIEVIGSADDDYPLQKKRHSYEFLREIAHLRPRTNTFGAVFRVRNALSFAIHKFFQERGFLYLNTPIITSSDCEGAGAMFQVTTLDVNNPPRKEKDVNYSEDFFGKKASLTVSGQLEGELFAAAFDRIYTFGPTFRAENSNTARHLSEFWMVEPEIAFSDLNDDMALSEDFLKYVFSYALNNCSEDMTFFDNFIQKGIIGNLETIINTRFEHITYTDAVKILLESDAKFDYPVKWGADLQSEHERFLTEKKFNAPVIITDYPKEIKAFYMKLNDDGKTVRAMDVLVPGVGEIIGGSERESRYDVLISRMKDFNLNIDDYYWYTDLRRYGTVPHCGFGLGFERLVQFVSGMQNIRDVIPFPRTPKNLHF